MTGVRPAALCLGGALVVGCGLPLAGCASSPAPAAPTATAAAAPPLTGTLGQGRTQMEERTAKATLTLPGGAEPVTVTGLELVLPGYTSDGPTEQSTRYEPGRTVALVDGYGEPDCAGPADGPARALLTVDGSPEPVVVTLDDEAGRAAGIRTRECTAQRLAALVPLAWQDAWTTEGAGADLVAVGRLDVGPVTGTTSVVVDALDPTTLFRYEAQGLPLTLSPGERATLTVLLSPARCDPHAVADDKVGFAPVAGVRVGEEALRARVWVPEEQRRVALDALAVRCAAD